MSSIERLKQYARMEGPAGTSTKENIEFWSARASANSQIAPRAAGSRASNGKPMPNLDLPTVPDTGKKMVLRDTSMQPYRSRKGNAAITEAKSNVNHFGSSYMKS